MANKNLDDVVIAKLSNINECLRKIEKVTKMSPDSLDDPIVEDVFVLNCQRAVQGCIDLAHYIISKSNLPVPSQYRESFAIISREGIISRELCEKMQKMVGFRNIAVHEYDKLNKAVLKAILMGHLSEIEDFCTAIKKGGNL